MSCASRWGEEMLLMAQGHPRIGVGVARAILSLPPSHPKRDVPRAEALVRRRFAAAVDDDDASSFVSSVIDLLRHCLASGDEAVALYAQAQQRLPVEGEPQLPRRLNAASLSYHAYLAARARDDGDVARRKQHHALARERADAIGAEPTGDYQLRQSRMLFAMLLDVDDEEDAATSAAAWALARSGNPVPDALDRIVAYHEGRKRIQTAEYETAARLFAPVIDAARNDYLDALRDADL